MKVTAIFATITLISSVLTLPVTIKDISKQFHLVTYKPLDAITLKPIVINHDHDLVISPNISTSRNFTGIVSSDGFTENIFQEYLFIDDFNQLGLSKEPNTGNFTIKQSSLNYKGNPNFTLCGDDPNYLRVYVNEGQNFSKCGYTNVVNLRALGTYGYGTGTIPNFPQ